MDHRSYGDSCLFGNSAYDFGVPVGSQGTGMGDYGPLPCIFHMPQLARGNREPRKSLWTGGSLKTMLTRLCPGQCIGPERQLNFDQFFYVLSGSGRVCMGSQAGNLKFCEPVGPGSAILIPAGTWMELSPGQKGDLILFSLAAPVPLPGRGVCILEDGPEGEQPFSTL